MDIFRKAMNLPLTPVEDLKVFYENCVTDSEESYKTLKRIEDGKKVKTKEDENKELQVKFKREQNLYDSYDPFAFETKLRLDSLFYEHVFEKLPQTEGLEAAVASFYKTVRDLYEVINIKPENHRSISSDLLVESVVDRTKRFHKIVMEHINNNFYRLSPEKRKEKYLSESQEYAKTLIQEGISPDDAISVAIKTEIFESLVRNVAIPKQIQSRIRFLCEDKDYGLVFDQEHLKTLWEDFNQKAEKMSRIFAVASFE